MPINSQPSFASWPITPAMKILLSWEEKWTEIFSLNPEGLILLLQTLFEQLDKVDYFINLVDTKQLFKFLRKLIESKPQNSQVSQEINNISVDLFEKIILKKRFNETEAKVPVYYLNLINLMLEPDHRYLFEKPEITIRTTHFLMLSTIPFNSSEILSQFRHTLLSSFQCKKFIKDHASLIRVISNLAKTMEKNAAECNELAAMHLFDTLGVLSHTLKNTQGLNQARIELSIQRQRRLIYNQFKPYVERDLLKNSVYKFFLTQSYKDSENLTLLCKSNAYRSQCLSDYRRFSDAYRCRSGQRPDFLIDIQHNNRSRIELDHLCEAMTAVESFIPWMEEHFGFRPNYNASHYFLYLADSRKNFLIDNFLFDRYDLLQEFDRVLAVYTPSESSNQTHLLLGSTHTYTNPLSVFIHEYVHHLSALYIKNLTQDLTLPEGLAKLYSEGICSKGNFRNLKNYASDTLIFEFFKTRRFPFYFNALKWVAYLVNEQPKLFKTLVSFLQTEDRENYYATINAFIYNISNQEAFVDWSHQQVEVCNDYLAVLPDGHQPVLIYLEEIKNYLNLTAEMSVPFNSAVSIRKRETTSSMNESHSKIIQASGSKEVGSEINLLQKVPLPLSALSAGFLSACLDDVNLTHSSKYPLLPVYINFGIKPLIFASISAILDNLLFDPNTELEEKLVRLYIYALTNYFSVLIGQPVAQKIAEKIHNKMACVLIQMVAWSLFWNPSLFFSKNNQLLPTLFLQLIQGLCFKVGEETYQLGKRVCYSSSFWHKKKPQAFDRNDAFLNENQEMPVNEISLR
jgi:hypothetical protein